MTDGLGEAPYHDKLTESIRRLDRVEDKLDAFTDDVRDLRSNTALTDDDLVILLWGRQHDRTKSQTEAALEALDAIGQRDDREVLTRLVAAFGKMSLDDSREFVDDLYDIRDRYGDFAGDG